MRWWLVLTVCGPYWAGEPRAHAQEHRSQDEYEGLIHAAMLDFNRGAYLEAHALFDAAQRLDPSAGTLRAMGLASLELRRYARAARELSAALSDNRKPLTCDQREQTEEALSRANRHVGSFTFELSPPTASIYLDNERVEPPSLQLDPGAAVVRVRAEGYQEEIIELTVDGGEHETLSVTLKPTLAAELTREGTSALLSGQVAHATELLSRAIEADPGHAPAYRNLGLVLERRGKTADAIATYDKYLTLEPNAAPAGKVRDRVALLRK